MFHIWFDTLAEYHENMYIFEMVFGGKLASKNIDGKLPPRFDFLCTRTLTRGDQMKIILISNRFASSQIKL